MNSGHIKHHKAKKSKNDKQDSQVRRVEPTNTYNQSPLITLYRHIGNQAVQRLVAGEGLKSRQQVQPKQVNNGMPEPLREKMEAAFDTDFSDVKVHPNSSKASELEALAYTQGNEIHFAPGMYNPYNTSGRQILGHELAHMVQQREGRVKPTMQMRGLPVNDNPSLESEADRMGAAAFSGLSPLPSLPSHPKTKALLDLAPCGPWTPRYNQNATNNPYIPFHPIEPNQEHWGKSIRRQSVEVIQRAPKIGQLDWELKAAGGNTPTVTGIPTVKWTALHQHEQNSINSALPQFATNFFHQNNKGHYPAVAGINTNWSPYVEFNTTLANWGRIIYDVPNQRIWISNHYNNPMEIIKFPAPLNDYLDKQTRKTLNGFFQNDPVKYAAYRAIFPAGIPKCHAPQMLAWLKANNYL